MRSSEVSRALKRIASEIEASKNPRKDLVASELKNLIRHIASSKQFVKIYFDGSRGWSLGEKIEASPIEAVITIDDGDEEFDGPEEFHESNGVFVNNDNNVILVPV